MPTMYHPDLPKGQNVIEVPDEAEGTISVYEKSGWTTDVPRSAKSKSETSTESERK